MHPVVGAHSGRCGGETTVTNHEASDNGAADQQHINNVAGAIRFACEGELRQQLHAHERRLPCAEEWRVNELRLDLGGPLRSVVSGREEFIRVLEGKVASHVGAWQNNLQRHLAAVFCTRLKF